MDNKKIMERIAKLASKTVENGCTMEEALAASKMVQKLIAKYHIDMTEYKGEEQAENIEQEDFAISRNWEKLLIHALAENYCCEYCISTYNRKSKVYVMGRDTDRKTCLTMFNMFHPLIKKGIQEAKKEAKELFGTIKGIENRYTNGYIEAITNELKKQCRALALVVPQEVTDKFKEAHGKLRTFTISSHARNDVAEFARNKGYSDGMDASRTKAIA